MFHKKRFSIVFIVAAMYFISTSFSYSGFETSFSKKDSKGYTIGAGDVLEISVYEEDDLSKVVRVSEDGYISFPLIGRVKILGLVVNEAEKQIEFLLEKDYLVDAQVTVFVKEYGDIFVFGEVNKPGSYKLEGEMSVLEAITVAGGFTEFANPNSTKVIRVEDGEEKTIKVRVDDITKKGDKSKDILLKPNDVIIVP